MPVKRLSESMINRIAAGEVVERPSSVIKELIENAIDAGADKISVVTSAGGKNLIRIVDSGCGMTRDDLLLAVERHCTSKISEDLLDIRTMGFRGEALPSIGSVSRLHIRSRHNSEENGWSLVVDNGQISEPEPVAMPRGCIVEVTALFASIPARLKFMKTDRAENNAISDIFKRIAMAFPAVHFSLTGEDRAPIEYHPSDTMGRISQVLGKEFQANALEIDAEREHFRLYGFTSIPTYNRGNALHQYFFVNGRPVRDKALLGALRGAYSDFLPSGRHPVSVLFVECDPGQVDVNVHPAKVDVRFRDAGLVRGLVVGSIRQAITASDNMTSTLATDQLGKAFQTTTKYGNGNASFENRPLTGRPDGNQNGKSRFAQATQEGLEEGSQESYVFTPSARTPEGVDDIHSQELIDYPLGAARAQLHENYIVAQTNNGMIMVDQHAAHERIVYEKLKAQMEVGIDGQLLLIPQIVELDTAEAERILEVAGELAKFGLGVEGFGDNAVMVRETPSMLGEVDCEGLLRDLADELAEMGQLESGSVETVQRRLEKLAATIACHGSVRSGRIMRIEEMNALLRQMENTPNSDQCNHGRPTWIKLDLKDIERLFGR